MPKPVPEIQVKKIDKILKRDAEEQRLTGGTLLDLDDVQRYDSRGDELPVTPSVCKSAGRCAIGALLIAANFPLEKFIKNEAIHEYFPGSQAAKLLKKEYGLLPAHTAAIENINDTVDDCQLNQGKQLERYEEVMGLVSFIEVAQENGVRFETGYEVQSAYECGEFDRS